MNKTLRIISISALFLILIALTGGSAFAAETEDGGETEIKTVETEAGSFLVKAESADNFRYENGHLYIYGGTVSVMTDPAAEYSADRIEISGYAVLILDGVRIKASDGAAIRVLPGADVEIRLAAPEKESEQAQEEQEEESEEKEDTVQIIENYVEGAAGYAGIEVGTLPGVDGAHTLAASLRIKGEGHLTAVGGAGAAAIGGNRGQSACGIIVVEEGNVKAVAGSNADGIGCGQDNISEPVFAPLISEDVSSLLIFTTDDGKAVASAANNDTEQDAETEEGSEAPEGFAQASMICASFVESGDGSLAGLENVRVKDTADGSGTGFNMPAGYRSFAAKVDSDSEYMIEQGGRVFAKVTEESFEGEITEGEEADLVFSGSKDYDAARIFLAPVQKAPAIDISVTGQWEDGDDLDGTRPDSVMVTLYANGNETGRTITLSEENDWSGTFDDLAVYSDSVKQAYSVVEERIDGYTGMISGSDRDGYTITNVHEPLPEGRSSDEEVALRSRRIVQEGRVVATVLTTKVSRTTPARTSTTIKKTKSAKTADCSNSMLWGGLLLAAIAALFIWMRIEQHKEKSGKNLTENESSGS